MIEIYLHSVNYAIKPKFFTYSGGEEQVTLPNEDYSGVATIKACVRSSSDFMRLVMTSDALSRFNLSEIHLVIPYLPYARQDRICDRGQAFASEQFNRLLDSLGFTSITVADPHSANSVIGLHRLSIISQRAIVVTHLIPRILGMVDVIVSPDDGSKVKSSAIFSDWQRLDADVKYLQASKIRESGTIVSSSIPDNTDLSGETCLILDDICDGGATFAGLANKLREAGAKEVYLYVTHGIFRNGLAATGCDKVFTTDSFGEIDDGRITIKRFFNV